MRPEQLFEDGAFYTVQSSCELSLKIFLWAAMKADEKKKMDEVL
jgi:hypothetical protein